MAVYSVFLATYTKTFNLTVVKAERIPAIGVGLFVEATQSINMWICGLSQNLGSHGVIVGTLVTCGHIIPVSIDGTIKILLGIPIKNTQNHNKLIVVNVLYQDKQFTS